MVALLVALTASLVIAAMVSPAAATTAGLRVGAWNQTLVPVGGPAVVHAVDEGRVLFSAYASSSESSDLELCDTASGATTVLFENGPVVTDAWLSGNHLLYTLYEVSGNSHITRVYLRDLATGQVSRLSDESWQAHALALTDTGAVWEQYRWTEAGIGPERQLVYYPFSTGVLEVLDEGEGSRGYSHFEAANDQHILWFQVPVVGPDGLPALPFRRPFIDYSTVSGEKIEIPVSDLDALYRTLEGDTLYYTAQAGDSYELHTYDLASGADARIVEWSTPIQNMTADGEWVAWAYWDHGAHIVAYHQSSGAQFLIPSAYQVGGLELTGGLLTWKAEPGFATASGGRQLFAADLSAKTVTRLTDAQSFVTEWDSGGDVIACSTAGLGDSRVEIYQPSDPDDAEHFADVPPNNMYWTAVIGLARLGAAAGYPVEDGMVSFRPDSSFTRGHFAKLLVEALDLPRHGDYVQTLAHLGILRGTAPGGLSPNEPLTRAQLATLIVRAADTLGIELLHFLDRDLVDSPMAQFDRTHGPNVAVAQFDGLLNGVASYKFGWDPWASATRGEAAQVLWNLVTARGAEVGR